MITPSPLSYPFAVAPGTGVLHEVATGVAWLRMPLPFALDHINLWLLADGDEWTQVDCGYGDEVTRDLWVTHFTTSLRGKPIARVIATHYHPDHLGNAAWLAARFACPTIMPTAEFLTAHAMAAGQDAYSVSAVVALFETHGMTAEHATVLKARGNGYRVGVPELPWSHVRLLAADELSIGNRSWRVIPGYGHSPEHAALYCAESGVCISGDMLLPRISTNVAVWPAEPDGDPLRRFLGSLTAFADLPPDTLILPSHGLPFRGARIRVEQLRAHHAARLAELEAAASTPQSAADVVPLLFRRELDIQQRFFAMGEAIAHLNFLWHQRRLDRSRGSDGILRFVRSDARSQQHAAT